MVQRHVVDGTSTQLDGRVLGDCQSLKCPGRRFVDLRHRLPGGHRDGPISIVIAQNMDAKPFEQGRRPLYLSLNRWYASIVI
jgi:hypothetical protein